MNRFDELGIKYSDLVWDIWQFYMDHSIKSIFINDLEKCGWNPDLAPKCAIDFSINFKDKYHEDRALIQPKTVAKICDKLCENDIMSKMMVSGFNGRDGMTNFYQTYQNMSEKEYMENKKPFSRYMNNLVYGFSYIYKNNRENVRPIWTRRNGKPGNGTCFNSVCGIVTAKHCLEECDELCIDGISADVLKNAKILGLDDIDLALIIPQNDYHWSDKFLIGDCEVLDEILVMGFPNHCGFDRFLTATTGEIAAIEYSYLAKYKLMLLTGKIKGGNSGGPVLDKKGYVVGIVTEIPAPDGEYDEFGYGMAIPSTYLTKLNDINNNYNFVNEISSVES